jgi:hypothetical protein
VNEANPQPAVVPGDLSDDARAALCELDEQDEKISLLLRASEVGLDKASSVLEDAVRDWLAFGAVRGALFAHVGEQCLKYSGRTKGELRKRIRKDRGAKGPGLGTGSDRGQDPLTVPSYPPASIP